MAVDLHSRGPSDSRHLASRSPLRSQLPIHREILTEDERTYIRVRLSSDTDTTRNEAFSGADVLKAVRDHTVRLYGLGFHTMSLPLYTLSLFLPRNLGIPQRRRNC